MNTKQAYTLAYRTFRTSKGSAVLRADLPILRAWETYELNFLLNGEDPVLTRLHDKTLIHYEYLFSSAYRWSKVGQS